MKALFELLFRKHQVELLAFANRRSSDLAEDVVQDSFLRLIQHPEPQAIENHRAYLYRLTANNLVDHQRKLAVRSKYMEEVEELDELAANLPGPDVVLHHQQVLQNCMRVLDELPEEQRAIFLLHRYDGLSYPQIGKLLKLSPRAVERLFNQALEHCFVAALRAKE